MAIILDSTADLHLSKIIVMFFIEKQDAKEYVQYDIILVNF